MRELQSLKEDKLVFYDIETAPLVKELEPNTPLYDSWEYKVNKDGEKTEKEVISTYAEQAGLYPEFAKIVSIVMGKIIKGKIVLITYDHENEKELLSAFNEKLNDLSGNTLAGFVNKGFDTPFTYKRMLINGIQGDARLDSSGLKPWEVEEVDLAEMWKLTSFNRSSLINIATALGLPSPKDDINGSDVGRVYWHDIDGLERISTYCRKDVETTINVFRKMCFREPLETGLSVIAKTVGDDVIEKNPVIQHLFSGGRYTAAHRKTLSSFIRMLNSSDKEKVFTVLNSIVSTAKGKKTKFTKANIKELKEIS